MAKLKTSHKAILLLIMITIIWGYSFISTSKLINGGFTSEMMLFLRFGIGALAIFIFAFKSIRNIEKRDIIAGAIVGCCIIMAMYLQNLSLSYTTVSKTAFISSTAIIIVPFLAALINKSRITKIHILGLSVAFIGGCILSLNPTDLTNINFGDFLSFLSTFGFALQVTLLAKFTNTNSLCVAFVQTLVVSLGGLVLVMINGFELKDGFNTNLIPSLLYLGIFATGVCYLVQTWAAKHVSEVLLSVIISSQAVVAAIFDVIIFNSPITLRFLLGASLISLAVLYLTFAKDKTRST